MIVLKTAREIELIRKACIISAEALELAGEAVKPGVTTYEIDKIAYDYIKKQGAEPNFLHLYGFPATACISINDEVIHGIPSKKRVIREGDIVSIDLGAKVDGYNGDNAATFAAGKISDAAKRLCDTTRESLYKGIEQAVAGGRIGDVASAVQTYCEVTALCANTQGTASAQSSMKTPAYRISAHRDAVCACCRAWSLPLNP